MKFNQIKENQLKEEFSQIVKEQGLDINNKDDLTHLAFACYCGYVDVKETLERIKELAQEALKVEWKAQELEWYKL